MGRVALIARVELATKEGLLNFGKDIPTYEKLHRKNLLSIMFAGTDHATIRDATTSAKEGATAGNFLSRGGHGRWVVAKLKRTTIRLLCLRYRLDKNLSRREANQQLLRISLFAEPSDAGQSSIRKATASARLDAEIGSAV